VEKLEEKKRQEEDAKRKREEALRLQTEEKRRYTEFCFFFFFLQDYVLHFIQCACPPVMLIFNFCINVLVYPGGLEIFDFLFLAIFVSS